MNLINQLITKFSVQNLNKRKIHSIQELNSNEQFKYLKTKHSFHLVDPSPWPLVASLAGFFMTSGGVLYLSLIHI